MKTFRALLFSLFVLSNSVLANTYTTDMTDLWWNANESGWGVTATHQREVIFLTFFVYATDNRAQWYTAQVSYTSQNAQGALVFTGPMYTVTGPWFGASFNPNAVGVRQVGTATFAAFIAAATLTYSVDGIAVSKELTRQTFRNNNLTGQYFGVSRDTLSGCSNPADNGTSESTASFTITHSGTSFRLSTTSGTICTWAGTYTQTGRMGRAQGTVSCPGTSESGVFDFIEMEATPRSISWRNVSTSTSCSQITGYFAAILR